MDQRHLGFKEHDENKWKIRDEVDQDAAQSRQIGLGEEGAHKKPNRENQRRSKGVASTKDEP